MKIDWQLIKFPFADTNWLSKSLIGGLLALVGGLFPIPFFFLLWPLQGYGVRIMRDAINGKPAALPEWDDWGKLFGDGLKVWVVGFVYGLPLWVLFVCGYCGLFLPVLAPLVGAATDDSAAFGFFFVSSWFIGYAVFFVAFGIAMLIMFPVMFLSVAATTRMVALDSLSAAFEFGKVWELARRGFGNYVLAVINLIGVVTVISLLSTATVYTVILSCLYPVVLIFVSFYTQALSGALFGQAYYHTENAGAERAALAKNAAPSGATGRGTRRADAKK